MIFRENVRKTAFVSRESVMESRFGLRVTATQYSTECILCRLAKCGSIYRTASKTRRVLNERKEYMARVEIAVRSVRADAIGYVIPYRGSPKKEVEQGYDLAHCENKVVRVYLCVFCLMCAI